MNIARRPKPGFVESAASSDMAFLLIIYFIVIAGFNINKGFLLTLPAKDSTRLILKDDLLRFEMDRDGNILYADGVLDIPDAEKLIRAAENTNPNIAVMLTIDPATQWQRVVSFVELVQDLKVDSFSFTMRR